MRRAALGSVFVLLASMAPSAGCGLGSTGDDLGTYDITLTMTANTCGAQYGGFQPSASFDATLSARSGTLRWRPTGAAESVGSVHGTTSFRLSLQSDEQVIAPDRRYEYPGCVLRRSDVIEAVFTTASPDAGSAGADGGQSDGGADVGADASVDAGWAATVSGFTGTESIVLGQVEGTDCRPMVGAGNGQVNALPCTVSYAISARRR